MALFQKYGKWYIDYYYQGQRIRENRVREHFCCWRSIRRSLNAIVLTSVWRQQRVPGDLDKSLETAENSRIRSKSEDRNMLTSILFS